MRTCFTISRLIALMAMLIIVSLTLSTCTESVFVSDEDEPDEEGILVGTWEWRQSCGGFAGWCIYADSVDYTQSYTFEDDYVVMRRDDSVTFVGAYQIVRKPFWTDIDTADVLIIEGQMEMRIELSGDTLSLVDHCMDCFGHIYVKAADEEPEPEDGLIGNWAWLQSCGGFAGGCITPETTGQRRSYTFKPDYFIERHDGIIVRGGAYWIRREQSIFRSDSVDVLYQVGISGMEISIESDTLALIERCADCYGHQYVRRRSAHQEEPEALKGIWEWTQSCGGAGGICDNSDSLLYAGTLHFVGDYVIERRNDSVTFVLPYQITREPLLWEGDSTDVLSFELDGWVYRGEMPTANNLILFHMPIDGSCQGDCYHHFYARRR